MSFFKERNARFKVSFWRENMIEKTIHHDFSHLDYEKLELQNLINLDELGKVLNDFYRIAPFPTALLNLEGEVLLESHWEPICVQFHRASPETAAICTASDTHFNAQLLGGDEKHILYRCGNGLYDAASPITIEGQHLGNFFIGQFLLEPPDEEFFRNQAQKYGFEEETYLEALSRVPITSEHDLKNKLDYLCHFAEFLGNIGLKEFQRDRAEQALRQSESYIRTVMDNFPIGVAVNSVDPSMDISYMNDNFPRLYRTTREALAEPDAFWNCVYEDSVYREEIKKRVVDDCASGNPDRMHWESIPITRNGEETTFVSARNTPVPDKQLMISTVWDVTDRKRAEKQIEMKNEQLIAKQRELTQSEVLFRGLSDNMTSGFAIYEVMNDGSKGSDYIVKSFNKTSLEIEGKILEEVVGKSLFDLRPTIDDYGLISILQKVWESGEPAYFPVKIYQDKKISNYYENYVFKIPSGEVVTIYNDITDHKNAEMALKESKERFELAMNFSNDGIFDWDLETNEVYYSPGWKRMLGYEEGEIKNDFSEWEQLTRPEDVKSTWTVVNELLEGKRNRFETEFQMRHKDGHWVDILSRANVVFDEKGKGIRIVGTHVDITERKKLESRLRHAEKMESIGILAGGVAHDFNNILGIILGNAELALDDVPEWNPAHEFLKEIRSSSLRAKDVVQELLRFSRKSEAQRKPVEICQLVKDSMKMLRTSIPTSIDFSLNLPESPNYIHADPTQINQILMNLASNAADAMDEEGGVLEISLQNLAFDKKNEEMNLGPGDYIKLSVKDTGAGIETADLGRIFDPYFTTKDIGKGTGMGLAIVYGIVKRHGAGIRIDTKIGKGTTFELFFPAIELKPEPEKKTEHALPMGTETILFVDDEASMVKLNRQRLERLGYTVIPETDPSEALAFFSDKPDAIDLVITDMTMPGMTGDKLVQKILEIRPDTPIILCTGYSERISEESAKNLGIRKYIEKPIDMANLARSAREVLDGSKQ